MTSNETELSQVAIEDINREHTQLRAKMDPKAVEDYAETYRDPKNEMPAPVVFEDEDGEFHLGDGYHRLQALESIDRVKVWVEIRQGSLSDAILFAAQCNSHNAVRFTARDKRNAVVQLRKHYPKMTLRDVAQICGVSYGIAQDVNKKLKNGEDPLVATDRNGADEAKRETGRLVRHKDESDAEYEARSNAHKFLKVSRKLQRLCDGEFRVDRKSEEVATAYSILREVIDGIVPHQQALSELGDHGDQDSQPATDGEYEDADEDPSRADESETPKQGRGRPKARFHVTGSRGTWFVEDRNGECDDYGPFESKEIAMLAARDRNNGKEVA